MKETWDKRMKVEARTNSCGRSDDLVTFLYGEATNAEAADFENHMQHCVSCRAEFAAFAEVREAVGEWRQLSLGSLAAPAFEANAAQVSATHNSSARKRSALTALREFFALSPMWMRAATAAIALLFCALAAIAVAYFAQKPQTIVVSTPVKSGYSQEEVEKMLAEAQKRNSGPEAQTAPAPTASPELGTGGEQVSTHPQSKRNDSGAAQAANNNRRQRPAPRNRVHPALEQAAPDYLPFTASVDDEQLPSLADLVNDDN